MTATEELLPCPFCGGEAHLEGDYSSERDETMWNVWHECDGFEGESAGYGFALRPWFETPWYKDEHTAIAAWNRRTERGRNVLPRLDEPVDYLCDMCANGCDERRVIRVGQSAYDVCERWEESEP